ncbi:tyrosine recombinase [Serratia marcescens]|uniref:Tyrosine recombinase n=1 Tax=Serratia marcescens TaxID=615 RepID=A0A379Y0B7_SERMA|nr:tyrosine recombinase [Serratia marcescens]
MSQRKYLTQSEVERLLQQALAGGNAERDYCLILHEFLSTAFRVSEVCHLRLSDLDLRGAQFVYPANKERVFDQPPLAEG